MNLNHHEASEVKVFRWNWRANDAIRYLRCSYNQLTRWRRNSGLPCKRLNNRFLFNRELLKDWATKNSHLLLPGRKKKTNSPKKTSKPKSDELRLKTIQVDAQNLIGIDQGGNVWKLKRLNAV